MTSFAPHEALKLRKDAGILQGPKVNCVKLQSVTGCKFGHVTPKLPGSRNLRSRPSGSATPCISGPDTLTPKPETLNPKLETPPPREIDREYFQNQCIVLTPDNLFERLSAKEIDYPI